MGEATNPPEENGGIDDPIQDSDSIDVDEEFDEEDDDEEDLTSEELAAIDSKLDALNLALDAMESKRDNIHTQLMELLESSRKMRKELQQEQAMCVDADSQPEHSA